VTEEAQTRDEAEVLADEEQAPAEPAEQEAAPEKTEYLEFLGTDPAHGTEFYKDSGTHTVSDAHMKSVHDVSLGKREAVWKRGRNGRFLVATADLNPAAVEILAADPMFKLVEL
jgi:hypothetical protein